MNLPNAILCDIDGTLALFGDENPYSRDFMKDIINEPVLNLLHLLKRNHQIIIFSGRTDKFIEITKEWLKENGVPYDQLYMRKAKDNRPDVIIKTELYEAHVKDKYEVRAVFDDRLQVCRLWHELGLPLFRVGDPEATF